MIFKATSRNVLLIIGLVSCLLLSATTGIYAGGLIGKSEEQRSEGVSFGSASARLNPDALTTSHESRTGNQAAKHNPLKRPASHLVAITARIQDLDSVRRRLVRGSSTAPDYSTPCFTRPRGRAPPRPPSRIAKTV
jgi:hypothetical protein